MGERKVMSANKVDETDHRNHGLSKLNEWGIPNWRIKEAYGDVTKWTIERWRWEFYRRRDDLRKRFDENADATYLHNQRLNSDPRYCVGVNEVRPDDRGFAAYCPGSRELFGYIGIPNPRIGDQPQGLITPYEGFWHLTHVFDGTAPNAEEMIATPLDADLPELSDEAALLKQYFDVMEKLRKTRALGNKEVSVSLTPSDVAIKFDIDKPLGPQLDRAKAKLESIQKKFDITTTQKRRHPDKWLSYLRILDAKEAGATWSEMVDVLYADGTLRPWKTTKSRPPCPPPQTARDHYDQARELCSKF